MPSTQESPEQKIHSITEITQDLKSLIEDNFPSVWIRGEISNFKAYSSGHYYFTLKDEGAQLSAVMFRGFNRYLKFQLEDGMRVITHGRLAVYEVQGKYQILADHIEPDGIGALQLAFEQLKAKLEEEGLFDPERKRPLPFLPRCVGIVTSMNGAAIHDMLSVLRRRFRNVDILIYPVKVQGEGSKEEIVEALDYFSKTKCADVVILGRGGGSIEDLWAFNEEIVARAVARCSVPVISAVGHETDYTICDYVADLRAPTPSAAAELCVPSRLDLDATVDAYQSRLVYAIRTLLEKQHKHVSHLIKLIPSPTVLWDRTRLHLMDLEARLEKNMELYLRKKSYEVAELKLKVKTPESQISKAQQDLIEYTKDLSHLQDKLLTQFKHKVSQLALKIELLSPKSALKRGYIIGRKKDGRVATRKDQLSAQEVVDLVFYDGNVEVIVK